MGRGWEYVGAHACMFAHQKIFPAVKLKFAHTFTRASFITIS